MVINKFAGINVNKLSLYSFFISGQMNILSINQPSLEDLKKFLKRDYTENISLEGLYASSIYFAISAAAEEGIHIIMTNNREDALYASNDLYYFAGKDSVFFLPSTLNNTRGSGDISAKVQRTAALNAINRYYEDGNNGRIFIITYPHSLAEYVAGEEKMKNGTFRIVKGEIISHEFLREFLTESGFEKRDFVSEPGQYALRGSIIDLFSFSNNKPYRIDFFGDEVEHIKVFDIDSQISEKEVDAFEIVTDIYNQEYQKRSLFTLFKNKITLWAEDFEYFSGQIDKIFNIAEGKDTLSVAELKEESEKNKSVYINGYKESNSHKVTFHTSPQPVFNKNFRLLSSDIIERASLGYKVFILSENSSQIERLRQIFLSMDVQGAQFTAISAGIHSGFIDHNTKQCFYTDHQIFERFHKVKAERSVDKSERLMINELNSLQIGDYIVHIDHGVGQFGGLVRSVVNGQQQESVKLIYRDNDVLFVSVHGLHRISKYKSKDSAPPKIYKLGTGAWQKLKNQTKSKVKDIAKELIALYSQRKEAQGFAYSPDSYLQQELEASFIYEDTPDQIKATSAIKSDMEKPYPMDRLVCGDVGFGKTEVAIRAAFKAVADGKQVAVLVPTTILSLQHYQTFKRRLEDFPCTTDYISRLRSTKEIKEISEKIREGKTDIIIGTHRLLNKEIEFKDLGLLIIDEEQKFGVSAKERLKQLKLNVDTLTLSATPIPRTLQFSLLGARDLSIINTPPPNRQPVQTEIIDFNEDIIRDAINYELERGGQIFFVHNRVEDIHSVAEILHRLVPDAKICTGHGQMDPVMLEKRILDFIVGDYDILVSTTIIENGIDIPNANTIIINQAQNFGLSDLHQLRGRVGRSNIRAFCYLIVPSMTAVSEDSRRRLRAIEAFSDLGSGFNIAMQDLDIRGAGNMLGGEQSGFIADMGFETYQRILAEAFLELKEESGERSAKEEKEVFINDCSVDTDLEIMIPEEYIDVTSEKIRIYKELDAIRDEEELQRFIKEIEDRFGEMPESLVQLVNVVRMRWKAIEMGIEKIVLKGGVMLAYFVSNSKSRYYKSSTFDSIIKYLTTEKRKYSLKEQNGKLYLRTENVKSVAEALIIICEIHSGIA
jgi:transcription-repair coupling factor (superfamily II helicase)